MRNPIKDIVAFNEKAGLLEAGYDDFLESSFQIEEALEGFDTEQLVKTYDLDTYSTSPKDISRCLVETCVTKLSDVDRLDKACDAVVFAVGSMAKLGLNSQQITQALNIVMDANMAKLENKRVDEAGKLVKSKGFVGPEEKLQKLLDERCSQ